MERRSAHPNAGRERNDAANSRTLEGIALLECGDEDSLRQALANFEEAIALRSELALDRDPLYRWGLAAGWINRGDALRRLGREAAEAVRSYDEALKVLGGLEDSPAVRWRRAVAWHGRGLASEERGDFDRAIETIGEPADARLVVTKAAALLQRSLLPGGEPMADARAALNGVRELESSEPVAAETGLNARHRICRMLCDWLESPGTTPPPVHDWISSTTDLVDEALTLARAWERAGVRSMREVALDLFRLGLKVYGTCQPHFLAEFLLESLDPRRSPGAPSDDPRFQAAAVAALKETMAGVLHRGNSHLDDEVAKSLSLLERLRAADRRLAELQVSRASAAPPGTDAGGGRPGRGG